MNLYYYSIFSIFAIIAFIMVLDPNFSRYLGLLSRLIENNIKRIYYLIKFHPNNYFELWLAKRRSVKMAKELLTEINNRKRD